MKATIALKKIALNPEAEIVDILRHALAITENLNLEELKNWCKRELNGYGEDELVPEYRNIEGSLHAVNILTGRHNIINTDGVTIPMEQEIIFFQEALLKNQYTFTYTLSTDRQNIVKKYLTHDSENISIYQEIDRFAFKRVVDVVRTKILEFAIELEKQNILGEEWEFTSEEKKLTQNIHYHNLINNGNMSNHNENSNISQMSTNTICVIKGDFDSLASNLKSHGIRESDIQELQIILNTSSVPTSPSGYSPGLKDWMKKMIGKSIDGSWEVATSVAATIIASGIQNYFGLTG